MYVERIGEPGTRLVPAHAVVTEDASVKGNWGATERTTVTNIEELPASEFVNQLQT